MSELTRAEVHADARNRASRTWWQGLIAAVAVAVLGVVAAAFIGITPEQMFSGPFWVGLGVLALQAGMSALGSWIQRNMEGRKAE